MITLNRFALIILAFCIPVLAGADDSPKVSSPPIYTESDQTIVRSTNERIFVIELASNPTTGYSWSLKPYDLRYIKPIQHQYIPPKRSLIGAGGVEHWTFQLTQEAMAQPHEIFIEFIYIRPWEKAKVSRQETFKVITRPSGSS